MTVISQIEQAEQTAEDIRSQAVREARDMIASVEEATVAQARALTKTLHEESAKRAEEARVLAGDEIKALELRRAAEREALKKIASAGVKAAGQAIFERVVGDGGR